MSFFISSIEAAGLMSSPPVSKHTPLPTSVTVGPSPGKRMSISRGACAAARPTAWIMGKFRASRSSPAMTVIPAPWRSASARAAASSASGPMSEAGVLMRSRARYSPAACASTRSASTPGGQTSRARAGSPFL